MNVIQGLLAAVKPLPDGDKVDRLSYCYTTVGLVLASGFVSGWSFVGQPIQCWFPAYYKGWWMEYAIDYCYVQNTYFVPFVNQTSRNAFDFANHMVEIPKDDLARDRAEISYYQWVPFFLALQAFMFYVPILLWRAIYESTGFKLKTICETCDISGNMDPDTRKKNIVTVSRFLTQEHEMTAALGGKIRRLNGGGTSIVFAYLIVKVIFAINAIAQLWLLQAFLGTSSPTWGWDVASDLFFGREWQETGNFPRVTLCDFAVRDLGNLHRHTVQCVLMINMFNEKIFVGLWFWLVIMIAVTLWSAISWIVTSVTTGHGRKQITHYIHKLDPSVERSTTRRSLLDEFITAKLRPDGVFLVRLVADNSGDTIVGALLKELWDQFVQERGSTPSHFAQPLLLGKGGKDPIDESDL